MNLLYRPLVSESVVILLLRIILGVVFIAHGGQKVFGWFGGSGLEATVNSFQKNLGIAPFLTYLAAFTEFFGGIAVLVGILTRPAALGIVITMLVAVFGVHWSGGFFAPKGIEYGLTLLFISLAIITYGAGKFSIDKKFFDK